MRPSDPFVLITAGIIVIAVAFIATVIPAIKAGRQDPMRLKLCELHRTWYSRCCGPDKFETEERNDVTVVEFRRDGSFERRWYKNPPPNSSEWTHFFEYNDANQLITERAEHDGTVRITKLYEYDSAGRITQIVMLDEDGQRRVAESYSYDAGGRKQKIVAIDPTLPSGSCGTMFGVDGTDAAYGSPGATSITSIYDERARPIEHLFHGGGGELITRIHLHRDERGNVVDEVCSQQKLRPEVLLHIRPEQLEAVRMLFTIRRHHRYDEQNRRIETSTILAPNDIDRQTVEYNDHGDVVTTISESSHAEYDFGEEGTLTPKQHGRRSDRSEAQFRYQYDSHGNWIEKIADTPGGPIWSLERRTLSYFD